MFRFWYKFIPAAVSAIEIGEGEKYYNTAVKPLLHSFMESVFEDMCRYYTLRKGINGDFGCFITSVVSWWGIETIRDNDGSRRPRPLDIDVVAVAEREKKAVIGECKFRNEPIEKCI